MRLRHHRRGHQASPALALAVVVSATIGVAASCAFAIRASDLSLRQISAPRPVVLRTVSDAADWQLQTPKGGKLGAAAVGRSRWTIDADRTETSVRPDARVRLQPRRILSLAPKNGPPTPTSVV